MRIIQHEVRQFVVESFLFGQNGDDLTNDQSFVKSGLIDSTGVLELVAFLEKRYGIAVDDHELVSANMDSVDRIVAFIQRKLQAQVNDLAS
jgi:acyl carrier protein